MKKTNKRLLAVLLSVLLLLGTVAFGFSAAAEEETPTVVASGDCGACAPGMSWTYDSNDTLTISGEGGLPCYDPEEGFTNYNDPHETYVPWYPYNMSMKTLVLEEGINQISLHNFCGCPNLKSVVLPTSLQLVVEVAFYRSSAIRDVFYAGDAAQWNSIYFADIGGPGDTGNEELLNANIHFYGEDWGYCGGEGDGTNLVWVFDSNGTLNISGEGKMANYPSVFDCPWYNLMCEIQIQSIVLKDGVTSVGNNAFYGFVNLTRVTIPDGVERIGLQAFTRCIALTSVSIPGSTTYIEPYAFYDCRSLQNVTIAVGVNKIAQYAFCFNSPAMNVFYAGSENQWKSIKMADVDNELIEANIHYNVVDWGYCGGEGDGTNLTWTLTSDGTLTVSGEGAMANYSDSEPAPWSDYFAAPGASITVMLEAGVTTIGTKAFPNTGLNELIVLNKDCDLSSLDIDESVMLRGYLGSTAEAYAEKYDKLSVFKPLCEVDYRHTVEVIEGVDSTCMEPGHTPGLRCVECDKYFYGCEALPLENHAWGDWVTTKEATTETEGVRTRTCTTPGCGATETQTIEKLTPTDNGGSDSNDDDDDGGFFGWLQRAMKGLVAWFQKLLRFFK
ncbi:MAG: leucine-rich repeat domain-containing protein [Clostridia bacterium]|nr:leucine-rich repeat domain-containing protein [Clostridia bacterium]